jgi:hypothetical protein
MIVHCAQKIKKGCELVSLKECFEFRHSTSFVFGRFTNGTVNSHNDLDRLRLLLNSSNFSSNQPGHNIVQLYFGLRSYSNFINLFINWNPFLNTFFI